MMDRKTHASDDVSAEDSKATDPYVARGSGLYFIGAMGANLVKIGWIRKIENVRLKIEATEDWCPYPVAVLLTVDPADKLALARVQTHFHGQHFHRGWFRYDGPLRSVLDTAAQDQGAARAAIREICDRPAGVRQQD